MAPLAPSVAPIRLLRKGDPIKLRGVTIYGPNWAYWGEFWQDFNWSGFIQPAISTAKSIGANCIRFACGGVSPDGPFNYPADAILQAELEQVCSYAASLGMVVYLQLGYAPAQQFLSNGSGVAAGTTAAAKIAGWADAIPNIVAIDTLNEWDSDQPSTWGTSGSGLTQAIGDLTTYMTAIRAATKKPLTISAAQLANLSAVASLVDFHDVHYYYYNNSGESPTLNQAYLASMLDASWYKGAFVIGETGIPLSQGADFQAAWMKAVPLLSGNAECFGAIFWTLADTFNWPNFEDKWGIYNQNLSTVRTQLSVPFSTWPTEL
jgi:hypothetical protein